MTDVSATFENTGFISKVTQYLDKTHKLNDYNEIWNLNQHLIDVNTVEERKLNEFNDMIVTKLMKMKQQYMLTDYAINETAMYTKVMMFTIIIAAFLLVIVSKTQPEGKKQLISICVGAAVFYLIVLMFILKSSANRRSYSWSQWYWDPVKQGSKF
jgi:RsiW-degrading membrane proteinase PrsW (M82 family)